LVIKVALVELDNEEILITVVVVHNITGICLIFLQNDDCVLLIAIISTRIPRGLNELAL